MLVLTAAACGIYASEFQSDGSLALYALAVTTVNVILVMMGTAVVGIYAALKLSRFVIACVSPFWRFYRIKIKNVLFSQHGLGMCTVIVLKMMLVIPFLLAIDSAASDNLENMIKVFNSKNKDTIARAQLDLRCCGTHSFRYYNNSLPLSCCPVASEGDLCVIRYAFSDGCYFKIGQMSKAPAVITSVAMIMMIILELIGLAISYGLLKSIALKDGTIDFRAMFKERMEQINATLARPFQKDGFATHMIETIKKKAHQHRNGENDEEKESDVEAEGDQQSSLAGIAEMRSTVFNVDVSSTDVPSNLPPHI